MGVAAIGLLGGCVNDGGGASGAKADSSGVLPGVSRGGQGTREVEAPEIFQASDSALWDGRPSLGGIWVAAPDVKDPERVVMVNPATGKTVTGALFRRERDIPGPRLQISSDAAEALGMLAGQPTVIQVTALRKVEVAAPAAVEAAAPADAAPAAVATAAAAPAAVAVAAAALDAADGAGTTDAAGVIDDVAVAATAEPPRRKTWKERRAEAKAQREAEKAAREAAAAAAAGAAALPGDDGAAPTVDAAGVAAIETAPLDARAPEGTGAAVAAPAPDRKTRRQLRAEQEAAAAAATAAAAAAAEAPVAPAPVPAATGRPIQVASFSKEENARRAVEALAKVGVSAQPVRSERGGTAVWGVVAIGDAELLKTIKGAGFADAYFLK